MEIRSGQIVLFYLFDVADTIDLQVISRTIGGTAAKLAPKQAMPAYIQYDKPPLSFEGEVVGLAEVDGFKPRVRLYDYGVVSIALGAMIAYNWPGASSWAIGTIVGVNLVISGFSRLFYSTAAKGVIDAAAH